MKQFIKNHADVIFVAMCTIALILFLFIGAAISPVQAEDKLVGKCIVVQTDSISKQKVTDSGYTIKVHNKVYKILHGPKGGYYYIKDDKKVYLTKQQRALIK